MSYYTMEARVVLQRPIQSYKDRSSLSMIARQMEVCRGNAPRSQLYESRASLTTLADRGGLGGDFNPRSPDYESGALNTKLPARE